MKNLFEAKSTMEKLLTFYFQHTSSCNKNIYLVLCKFIAKVKIIKMFDPFGQDTL